MSNTYFIDRVIKKKQIHIPDFYAKATLLHFLNSSYIFHMANSGITSINVCSIEWGKLEIKK